VTDFQIGDRVVLLADHPDNNRDLIAGATGTVMVLLNGDGSKTGVGVRMDERKAAPHSCYNLWDFWNPERQLRAIHEVEIQPSDMSLTALL